MGQQSDIQLLLVTPLIELRSELHVQLLSVRSNTFRIICKIHLLFLESNFFEKGRQKQQPLISIETAAWRFHVHFLWKVGSCLWLCSLLCHRSEENNIKNLLSSRHAETVLFWVPLLNLLRIEEKYLLLDADTPKRLPGLRSRKAFSSLCLLKY